MARGDHLEVNRGGFYHHGIDLGNGEVVHFTGEPLFGKADASVEREPITKLARRGTARLVAYPGSTLHPDHTCLIALGHWQARKKGYRLFTNNCEHLATYCKVGYASSSQVKTFFETNSRRLSHAILMAYPEAIVAALTGDLIVRLGKFVTRTVYEYIRHGGVAPTSIIPPFYRVCGWWHEPGVREDQKRHAEERLEKLLLEGLESGRGAEYGTKEWGALWERIHTRINKARAKKSSA